MRLLGKIADRLHITEDLMKIFNGDETFINDVLTVAMFPYVTTYDLDRMEKWQKLEKYPPVRNLSSPAITFLTQAISDLHRISFLKERTRRLQEDELLAVDSTTESGREDTLINVRWGKIKEELPWNLL